MVSSRFSILFGTRSAGPSWPASKLVKTDWPGSPVQSYRTHLPHRSVAASHGTRRTQKTCRGWTRIIESHVVELVAHEPAKMSPELSAKSPSAINVAEIVRVDTRSASLQSNVPGIAGVAEDIPLAAPRACPAGLHKVAAPARR